MAASHRLVLGAVLLACSADFACAQCVDIGQLSGNTIICSTIVLAHCEHGLAAACMKTCGWCHDSQSGSASPSPSLPPTTDVSQPPPSPPPMPPPPSASPVASPAPASPAPPPPLASPSPALASPDPSPPPSAAADPGAAALLPPPLPWLAPPLPPAAAPPFDTDAVAAAARATAGAAGFDPDSPECRAARAVGGQCYGDGKPPGGDGNGLFGSILPLLFLAVLGYCMIKYFRRAQGYGMRDGSGGWGGRGDPEAEGVGLVGTCLPTGSRRARNFVSDMQARRHEGGTRLAARDGAVGDDDDDML